MIIDATRSEFKNFLKMITFSPLSTTPEPHFFYLSDGYLWRQDSFRLCALRLVDMPDDIAYEYPVAELESTFPNAVSISISEIGMLHIHDVTQGQSWIAAAPMNNSRVPLQTLEQHDNINIEFTLPSHFLSRQLSIFQTKIRKSEFDLNQIDLILDLQDKTMSISSHPDEKVAIPITFTRTPQEKVIRYAFSHFKDFLANANKFNEHIVFRCKSPYYSVIVLSEGVQATLMHKKE